MCKATDIGEAVGYRLDIDSLKKWIELYEKICRHNSVYFFDDSVAGCAVARSTQKKGGK